jgi:hypothetical protein
VPFDRVNLDDDNVGASGLIEQWEQGGVAHEAAIPIRHPVDFHRLKQIGEACGDHDMVGGEFGTFENLDPAGVDISRGDKKFEFGQGPHLFEVDCLFEMIAQRIDVQGIEIVRARTMGEMAMSRLMLKSAKRASLVENLRSLRGLDKVRVR